MRKTSPVTLTMIVVSSIFLTGCRGPAPISVHPVEGMPTGTDGYPWWNDTVFYELFVRSFYDSDGDGIGDINGIIEKLDYLNDGDPETATDLGITGLWLMPIFPSPSYHGYDVIDYYDVNPDYGSLEDFQRLLEAAHQRGIRVTIDLVINHTSTSHPWFIESRNPDSEKRDWYLWTDQKPGYSGPWGQQVWYRLDEAFYYAVFWEGMPDLNLENQAVVAEINKIARFWLEMGVDGFRLDAAKHIIEDGSEQENTPATHAFWEQFRTEMKAVNPEAIAIGEVWSSTEQVKRYLEGDELDLAFEFDLAGSILDGVANRNPFMLKLALSNATSSYENLQFGTFLANHDQNRAMTRFLFDDSKARLAASTLLTAPGVPFLYYGEEIGLSGNKPDENLRTPFHWNENENAGFTTASVPWRFPNPEYSERNVALMTDDPESLLSHYRNLINLRNQQAALRTGGYFEVEVEQPNVLAYLRSSPDEQILVILNFNERPLESLNLSMRISPISGEYHSVVLYAPGLWESGEIIAPLSADENGGFEVFAPLSDSKTFPGFGVAVIQLQEK